jgi:hypothetical protein
MGQGSRPRGRWRWLGLAAGVMLMAVLIVPAMGQGPGQGQGRPGQQGGPGGINQVLQELDEIRGEMAEQHVSLATDFAALSEALAKQQASEPVFLTFQLSNSNRWNDDAEYIVPAGKKLRVEFVGVQLSGTSLGLNTLHTSVQLEVDYVDGEGATCNRPNAEGECSLRVPVIPLNNTETGANVTFQFPSTAGPVVLEAPPGARISSRLFSSVFGAPDEDTLRVFLVTVTGQLIDTSGP